MACFACSDSPSEAVATSPAPEQAPPSPAEEAPESNDEGEAEPEAEPADEPEEVTPVRSPDNRVLPELSSVRWGPDRREPFETLEELDAMLVAHFGRRARTAVRLRARHGRERMTLAVVLRTSDDASEADEDVQAEALQFDGEALAGSASVDQREGAAGTDMLCRCAGEVYPDLLLVRVVHGEENRIDHALLPADVCSGQDAELRLADFDRDGRVEVRADISYQTDVSCGARSESVKRLYVVDIADLVVQSSVVVRREQGEYFGNESFHGRARFTALDEDEYPDLEITGRSEAISDGEEPSRGSVHQTWIYEIASDSWVRRLED